MPVQTDPEKVSFADCIGLVSLLAIGDRDKTTPEQRRAMADALGVVLHAAADAVAAGTFAPLLPLLDGAREKLHPVHADSPHARLVAAIRAFTVDGPNGEPNGDAERQIEVLGSALERNDLKVARKAYGFLCAALANDVQALREAAEAFFGGDFRAPTPDTAAKG